MTAKESKAVAWYWTDACGKRVFEFCRRAPYADAIPLIAESALHAAEAERDGRAESYRTAAQLAIQKRDEAEAELGELRRRVGELADSWQKDYPGDTEPNHAAKRDAVRHCTKDIRQLLASDGGVDGDNEGEGK